MPKIENGILITGIGDSSFHKREKFNWILAYTRMDFGLIHQ
jgi:hypothetical protein